MSSDFIYITGTQIRAARAVVRWSARELAERAGVGLATVQRAEAVDGDPPTTRGNQRLIRTALEAAGVVFTDPNGMGPGVRLREP